MNIAMEFEQLYSRDELIGLVSTYFDKAPSVSPHTHYLCTQIPQIDTIITTNYDHLFECVYGNNLNVVVGTQYKTSEKKPVTLYKIHGDSSDSTSIVLTSKDYAKFYESLSSLIWSKLKVILAERPVLFIGYSLEDKNIEDIFEKVLSQVNTSKSEFFIAVPTLAEHKLRHFNTICKTTHLPIDGETLLSLVEKSIRENIVFDAIDKKISIDEAQAVAYKHGVQPVWCSIPNGEKTRIEVEHYIINPFPSLTFQGITIRPCLKNTSNCLKQPDDNSSEINEGEERSIKFVISGSDSTEPLDFLEETFNQVAFLVQPPINWPRMGGIALGRDGVVGPMDCNKLPDFL